MKLILQVMALLVAVGEVEVIEAVPGGEVDTELGEHIRNTQMFQVYL